MKSELFLTGAAVSSLSSSPSHLLRVESFVRIKSDAVPLYCSLPGAAGAAVLG